MGVVGQAARMALSAVSDILWREAFLTGRGELLVFWNAENWQRPYRFIPHAWLIYDCIDPSFSVDEGRLISFEWRCS